MRRDLLVTASGAGLGQIVVLLATPLLARIYSPGQFGVYAAIVSFAGVVATISALRYETAIPVVPTDEVPIISRLALLLPLFVAPLLVSAVALTPQAVALLKGNISREGAFVIAAVATIQGMIAVANALCTRRGEFVLAAFIRVLQPIGFVVIACLFVQDLSHALIASWLVAFLGGLYTFRNINFFSGWKSTVATCLRAWRYPVLYAPVSMLDTLTLALPVLAIITIFGDTNAGNYSQVQRLIGAPLLLVGLAVGQVFFKYAGDLLRSGQPLRPLFFKIFKNLLLLAIAIIAFVFIAGEQIITVFLGSAWRTDRTFLILVIAPVVFRSLISPLSSVFLLCHRIKTLAVWQFFYFVVTVIVIVIAQVELSFDGFLVALLCSEFAMYAIYFALASTVVHQADAIQGRDTANGVGTS